MPALCRNLAVPPARLRAAFARRAALLALAAGIGLAFGSAAPAASPASAATPVPAVAACTPLPTGNLTDAELATMVPEGSRGHVRIRWSTETQEDTYGFDILRADAPDGPYVKINEAVIPGEGTTNIPKDYCILDTNLDRGRVYYYNIESIHLNGTREQIEGVKATRAKVKTVAEERAWLKKKAAEGDAPAPAVAAAAATSTPAAASGTTATVMQASPAPASTPTADRARRNAEHKAAVERLLREKREQPTQLKPVDKSLE